MVIFICNIYLARTLSVENFGLFNVVQTVVLYFWVAVNLGITMYGIREVARNRDSADETINVLISIRAVTSLVVCILYIITIFSMDIEPGTRAVYLFGGAYLIGFALFSDWVLKGYERFDYSAIANTVVAMVYMVGVLLFVRHDGDTEAAVLLWGISYLIGSLAVGFYMISRLGLRVRFVFSPTLYWHHLRQSIYFTFSGLLSSLIHYLPILVLGFMYTNEAAGIYSGSYRIVITLCHAGTLFVIAIYPVLSELAEKSRDEFHRAHKMLFRSTIGISAAIAIVGYLLSDRIVILVLSSKYTGSIGVFSIMIWLLPIMFARNILGISLQAMGRHKHHAFSTMAGALISIALCLVLIKLYGGTGAAFSLLLSEAIVVAGMAISYYTGNDVGGRECKHTT